MKRVWFNHWFSTAYNIIELMRECPEELCIVGSNRNKYAVISGVCDEWYEEPDISGDAYVDFCVGFCKEHNIDIFVPRRQMLYISRAKERFDAVGVKIMAEDADILSVLSDKVKTYEYFRGSRVKVPDYRLVNDVQSFEAAYSELSRDYESICMKFVSDEGALSFRRITETRRFDPRQYVKAEVTRDELADYIREKGKTPDIMLMPYLSGTEISADCLATGKGLVCVPRYKSSGRHEFVRYDEDIIAQCGYIAEKTGLVYPFNVQFRLLGDVPYLLEINPRMSGGVQLSVAASGVNIPALALSGLLGRQTGWEMNNTPCVVSYIERPRIIKEEN